MRKLIILIILLTFITTAFTQTPAKPKTVAGRHKIELDDPVGDVQENDGKPGKDVVKVSIVSDGENLTIIAELEKKLGEKIKNK